MLNLIHRIFDWPFRGRQLRAMKSRDHYNQNDFVRSLIDAGADADVISDVWTILAGQAIDGYKPHPEDDLQYLFGLSDEDLDEDVILKLLETHHCQVPSDSELKMIGPINTARDLVMMVSSLKLRAASREPEWRTS